MESACAQLSVDVCPCPEIRQLSKMRCPGKGRFLFGQGWLAGLHVSRGPLTMQRVGNVAPE